MDEFLLKPVDPERLAACVRAAAERNKSNAAVWDREVWSTLRGHGGQGERFLAQLLSLYSSDARAQIHELDKALASEELATLRRAAHAPRGSSLSVGATGVALTCGALETAAAAGDASVPACVRAVTHAIKLALDELPAPQRWS